MKTKSLVGSYVRVTRGIPFEEPKFPSGTVLRIVHEAMNIQDGTLVYILQEEKTGLVTQHAWIGELDTWFFEVL